jgi:hypothetical protein
MPPLSSPRFILLPTFCAALLLAGCQTLPQGSSVKAPRQIEVDRATGPMVGDGRLDEADWARAKPIPFRLAASPAWRKRIGEVEGKGSVRMLHDDKNLYFAFEFEDADVVDLSKEDDQELYTLSDVAEIFLKPVDETWYWELHVTPKGHVSTYWFPGRGRIGLAMSETKPHVKPGFLRAATRTQGTVNNWHDRDKGWTAEGAIPWAKLDRDGPLKDPHARWTILLARYNYSRYRMKATGPELSTASPLSEANFHLVNEYPRIHLR